MSKPVAAVGAPPHCATCQCVSPWTRYSSRTSGYRCCLRCGKDSDRPGPEGWWWRHRPATGRGHDRGRATEAACAACAAVLGARQ